MLFSPQAELRSDALFTAERQRELDLSFRHKSSVKAVAGAQALEPAPGAPHVVKQTLAGHYGQGSASGGANGLRIASAVPSCDHLNAFVEGFVEGNVSEWERMFGGIRAAVEEEFAGDLPNHTAPFANVNDILSCERTWRDFLFTADEVHLQSVAAGRPPSSPASGGGAGPASGGRQGGNLLGMPVHHDGGRGFFVLAIGLWTSRLIRLWHADGNISELRTEPGHCYLANLVGVKHQVVHERGGGEAGRGHTHTSVLGNFEAIYFARSATFRHNWCFNERRLWRGVDGRLCKAMCEAYISWMATAKLELPSLADVRERRALHASRPSGKKKRRAMKAA